MDTADETPSALHNQMQHHWVRNVKSILTPDATSDIIHQRLRTIGENIKQCELYRPAAKKDANAKLAFQEALSDLDNNIVALNRRLTQLTGNFGSRPGKIEEVNTLQAMCVRLGSLVQEHYGFNSKHDLPRRKITRASQPRPPYPVYPEGTLHADELRALYQAREVLEDYQLAMQMLPHLEEKNSEDLVANFPRAANLLTPDNYFSASELPGELKKAYKEAFDKGVNALTRKFGTDDATARMKAEFASIEKCFKGSPSNDRTM